MAFRLLPLSDRGQLFLAPGSVSLSQEGSISAVSSPHGHFKACVEEKSGISYSAAARYMRAAKEAYQLERSDPLIWSAIAASSLLISPIANVFFLAAVNVMQPSIPSPCRRRVHDAGARKGFYRMGAIIDGYAEAVRKARVG